MARHPIAEQRRDAQRRAPIIVYLREIDAGTATACWVVCAKGDPGAVPFHPADS